MGFSATLWNCWKTHYSNLMSVSIWRFFYLTSSQCNHFIFHGNYTSNLFNIKLKSCKAPLITISCALIKTIDFHKTAEKHNTAIYRKWIEYLQYVIFPNSGRLSCVFNVSLGMSLQSGGLCCNRIYRPRPSYWKRLKSPRLKPQTFQSFPVLWPWPVNSITAKSS